MRYVPSFARVPASVRPFQVNVRRPRGTSNRNAIVSTSCRCESSIVTVVRSDRRKRTLIAAVVCARGDTYPRMTWVPVSGLFVSFRRSVIAKAAAVAASRPTMTAVERIRCKAASVYAGDRCDPHTVAQPHGPRHQQGDDDEAGRPAEPAVAVRLDELRARGEEHEREHEAQGAVAEVERELAAGEDTRYGADEQPQEGMRVDVAGDEVPEARHPEQPGGMEDVGADDLVRPQREDEEQCQPEEDAAADRRQPDDVAAEEADEHGRDLVAPPHDECTVADLAHADGGLQQHADGAKQERCAEDLTLRRLDAAAVRVLQPRRRRDAEERRRRAADEHPAAQLRLRRPELVVARAADGLEDRAVQDVGADRGRRVEAEDEDEDRRHERAAAHAGHADAHADGEAREDELPGHSSSRSSSAATMRSAASSIPRDAMSRCTSGLSGASYVPPAPVRFWIPPARAFPYVPFVS